MAQRGNGGIIGPANVPNAATASGVWNLEEQQAAKGLNSWPGFAIQRSLRFNSADSAYLNRTPGSATNRRTWTFSAWVKAPVGLSLFSAGASGAQRSQFGIEPSLSNVLYYYENSGSGNAVSVYTNALFRDPSAWYHFVLAFDTTQATDSNRVKIYVNGVQQAINTSVIWPTQNYESCVNNTVPQLIGQYAAGGNFNGYVTEVNFIDGQALTPSSFGITNPDTGVWQPKAYAGTYGTNGFYLNFSDNSNTTATTLGKDYSGNGNNWTPNNFSVSAGAGNDSLVDVPTPWGTDTGVGGTVRGNYCTFSPIQNYGLTLANGNLDVSVPLSSSSYNQVAGTIGVSAGKWYFEYYMSQLGFNGNVMVGVMNQNNNVGASTPYNTVNTWLLDNNANGKIYARHSGTTTDLGSRPAAAFTGMVAIDLDAGKIWFGANGTWLGSGDPATGVNPQFSNLSGVLQPIAHGYTVGDTGIANFGQRPFAYTAPSGFKALCTQNLPTPTIGATTATQANKYFDVVLRNGGGSSGGTYSTTVNMANGALLWDKTRNGASDHFLVDSVRGVSKTLSSNTTGAEATYANWFTGFNSGSFTTGSSDWSTGLTVVDWIWAANGAGVTNTAGSITSTVSANTTSGFSVVTYTGNGSSGATIGHGLGVAPKMIIVKNRSITSDWFVGHASIGWPNFLKLNSTAASAAASSVWNNTAPSSTVFTIGNDAAINNSGNNLVAYCFAEVPGFSKFGSYTGNGSTDGPFVYCGFRPAYVMIKASSAADFGSWRVHDTKRSPSNVVDKLLIPNLADAESTFVQLDILSNGFKIRENYSGLNANGQTLIFAAFAEAPQKFALAR